MWPWQKSSVIADHTNVAFLAIHTNVAFLANHTKVAFPADHTNVAFLADHTNVASLAYTTHSLAAQSPAVTTIYNQKLYESKCRSNKPWKLWKCLENYLLVWFKLYTH